MRYTTALAALALLCVRAPVLSAQRFFNVGEEVNGQINVQVNATLNDGIGEFQPLPNLLLTLYRSATDSLQLRTDEAGVLRFSIAPGAYRIASVDPVEWHGRSYRWNVALPVKRGMDIVNLTAANAGVSGARANVAPSIASADRPAVRHPVSESDDQPESRGEYSHKDGATGVLFGLLLPGGGQFYSGRMGKGFSLLGISIGTYALAISSCESKLNNFGGYDNCDGEALLGLVGYLTPWIYGMATAPGDARAYNRKHARRIAVEPVLDRHRGRTGLGLALRY